MNMKGKSKTEKGITLIALIITIVVLLILAAVAVTSIKNDGIIKHATDVGGKYNNSVSNEQGTMEYYETFLEYGGGITKEDAAELKLMERYVMGADGKGRDASEIVKWGKVDAWIDDEETEIDESTVVTLNMKPDEKDTRVLYIRYNDRAYKVILRRKTNISYTTEGVELVYKQEGREGTEVAYDINGDGINEECVIITDRNGLVEIISKDVAKDKDGNVLTLTLGCDDTSVTATTDIDGDGIVDGDDTAILSYNNAITRINEYCRSIVKPEIKDKVRSVGGTNNSYTAYHSTNYDNWGKNIKVDVASGDMQYELDLVKLSYHGIVDTTDDYWMASRRVLEDFEGQHLDFGMWHVGVGYLSDTCLWDMADDGYVWRQRH